MSTEEKDKTRIETPNNQSEAAESPQKHIPPQMQGRDDVDTDNDGGDDEG